MPHEALSDFIHLTLSALMWGAAIFITIFFINTMQDREAMLVNDANEKASVLSSYLDADTEARLKLTDMTLSKTNLYTDIMAELEGDNVSIAINGTNIETVVDIEKLKYYDPAEIAKLKNMITSPYYQKRYFYKVRVNNDEYNTRPDFNEFSDIARDLDLTHINYTTYTGSQELYTEADKGEIG